MVNKVTSKDLWENANDMAVDKWGQPNEKTFESIAERVINFIDQDADTEERIRTRALIMSRSFVPNTPCWINAGTDMKSLAACFVIGLEDNMVDIMDAAKKMALIMKEGGGVGISLSNIRPEFAKVGKGDSKRMASGPISFLKIFDSVVEAVRSAGVRRGAALANLRVDHPDIIKFIECKTDQHTINNFNLSVAITDDFMKALAEKPEETWITDKRRIDVNKDGKWTTEIVERKYSAIEVFDLIVKHMWENGEPGVQFIDNVNNSVRGKYTGRPEFIEYNTGIKVSNPCSETFLKENEACNIGSLNLYNLVIPFWEREANTEGCERLGAGFFSFSTLKANVRTAVDFMNRMIDLSEAPLEEINTAVKASRKIGIGIMGLADTLSALGIKYGNPEAVRTTKQICKCITETAEEYSLSKGYKNATLTLCAPTGTTGFVANVSQGIEPHYMRSFKRNVRDKGELLCAPRSLVEYREATGDYDEEGQFIKDVWPTAHEISPDQHLDMLIAVQEYQHNSVSKTINLPNDATIKDIQGLMHRAWQNGIKGFTCYRDGSRDSQVLYDSKLTKKNQLSKAENLSDKEDLWKKAEEIDNLISEDSALKAEKMAKMSKFSEVEAPKEDAVTECKDYLDMLALLGFTLIVEEESDKLVVNRLMELALGREADCDKFQDEILDNANSITEAIREALLKNNRVCLSTEEFESLKKVATLGYQNYLNYVKNADSDNIASSDKKEKRPRPIVTEGITHKLKTGCGNFYVTVNSDDKGICEVLTNIGRTGGCPSQSEAVSRLISLALRSGVTPESVIEQLKGIRCMSVIGKNRDGKLNNDIHITSCPDAIGKVMEKELNRQKEYTLNPQYIVPPQKQNETSKPVTKEQQGAAPNKQDDSYVPEKDRCPKCGSQMTPDGGCRICQYCGYSKCN